MTSPAARPRLEPLEDRAVPAAVGALDPSFGSGGMVLLGGGNGEVGPAAVDVGGGRVVVAGYATGAGGGDFIVQRVNSDGGLDPTSGPGGQTVVDFFGATDAALAVALDPAGNIVVGGISIPAGGKLRAAVTRLTSDGAVDATFGAGGRVLLPVAGSDLTAGHVLPDAAGVVVAGTLTTGGVSQFAVGRFTASGAVDTAFGTAGGKTVFNFSPGLSSDRLAGATRDAAGNVVVVGTSEVAGASRFAVARLTPGGSSTARSERAAGRRSTSASAPGTRPGPSPRTRPAGSSWPGAPRPPRAHSSGSPG